MINGVWRQALGQPSYLHTLPWLHQQVRSSVLALPEQKAGLTSERRERGNVIGYEVGGCPLCIAPREELGGALPRSTSQGCSRFPALLTFVFRRDPIWILF